MNNPFDLTDEEIEHLIFWLESEISFTTPIFGRIPSLDKQFSNESLFSEAFRNHFMKMEIIKKLERFKNN